MGQQTNLVTYPQHIIVHPTKQVLQVIGAVPGPPGPQGIQGPEGPPGPVDSDVVYSERSNYSPTLHGITLGSGGINECYYQYIGGRNSGAIGMMHLDGRIILGTGGSLEAVANAIYLPTGFIHEIFAATSNIGIISYAKYSTGGIGGWLGVLRYNATIGGPVLQFMIGQANVGAGDGGTYHSIQAVTSTKPLSFAADSTIYYRAYLPVERT